MFKNVDINYDGCLSKDEVVQAFKEVGIDASNEIQAIMTNLDINQSGALDFTELKIALIEWEKEVKKKQLRKVFKVKNETISLMSLKHKFFTILPHEWNEFGKKVKIDNGRIDLASFKNYIRSVID